VIPARIARSCNSQMQPGQVFVQCKQFSFSLRLFGSQSMLLCPLPPLFIYLFLKENPLTALYWEGISELSGVGVHLVLVLHLTF
jgi:hypothetical protein